MFDANPEREDDGEDVRALILMVIRDTGEIVIEWDVEPDDALAVADHLREFADELAAGRGAVN